MLTETDCARLETVDLFNYILRLIDIMERACEPGANLEVLRMEFALVEFHAKLSAALDI